MPGSAIGPKLDAPPQMAWAGQITILKLNERYNYKIEREQGQVTFGDLVRQQLNQLMRIFEPCECGECKDKRERGGAGV